MYEQNSILIVVILFILIVLANEVGYKIGHRYGADTNGDVKAQTNTIEAGTLGLLALILGFNFSMALQRYNDRSQAVISEANAIGTALLRTQLLPEPYDSISHALLQNYINLRLQVSNTSYEMVQEQEVLDDATRKAQGDIWATAVEASEIDPSPITTGYYINSLNTMIDAHGKYNALLQLHVPEVILVLLFIVFIISGALIGYSSGLSRKRSYIPAIFLTVMICLMVFIIIDLDRPKRGILKINQASMKLLKND